MSDAKEYGELLDKLASKMGKRRLARHLGTWIIMDYTLEEKLWAARLLWREWEHKRLGFIEWLLNLGA